MSYYIGQTVLLVSPEKKGTDRVGFITGQGDGDRVLVTTTDGLRIGNVRYGDSRDGVIEAAEEDRELVTPAPEGLDLFRYAPACYPASAATTAVDAEPVKATASKKG